MDGESMKYNHQLVFNRMKNQLYSNAFLMNSSRSMRFIRDYFQRCTEHHDLMKYYGSAGEYTHLLIEEALDFVSEKILKKSFSETLVSAWLTGIRVLFVLSSSQAGFETQSTSLSLALLTTKHKFS